MKKLTVLIGAMLLVLSVGQIISAKVDATAGISLGYDALSFGDSPTNNSARLVSHTLSGFKIGLLGNIYVIDRLSFALDGSISLGNWSTVDDSNSNPVLNYDAKFKFILLNIQAFARYDVQSNSHHFKWV